MMTLNEAIEHCREKACGNSECALEHQQLADWLEELQNYRNKKQHHYNYYPNNDIRNKAITV